MDELFQQFIKLITLGSCAEDEFGHVKMYTMYETNLMILSLCAMIIVGPMRTKMYLPTELFLAMSISFSLPMYYSAIRVSHFRRSFISFSIYFCGTLD